MIDMKWPFVRGLRQVAVFAIRPYLERHTVRTAAQQAWDKLSNGELPTAAEEALAPLRCAFLPRSQLDQ